VALLVDHYEDDWDELWWVRADGVAELVGEGPEMEHAIDLLTARYTHYRTSRPKGPVISIAVTQWLGWSASETS